MLLSISGRIGSGKDTFAALLVRAIYAGKYPDAIGLQNIDVGKPMPDGIQIVKFADALKDIVCRLTGCTREQLEDQDFKNSTMPEEWWERKGDIAKRMKPTFQGVIIDADEIRKPTYRQFLQELGTNVLRNWIPNIHVNATFATWKMQQTQVRGEHWAGHAITMGTTSEPHYPKWIITDMRFPNEVAAVKERGGIVIRINRKAIQFANNDDMLTAAGQVYKDAFLKPHESETALDDYQFWDAVVDNNGTIEELYQQAIKIVNQFKL